jgi:hypothetical protein
VRRRPGTPVIPKEKRNRDPGSAVHRYALHRIRETPKVRAPPTPTLPHKGEGADRDRGSDRV